MIDYDPIADAGEKAIRQTSEALPMRPRKILWFAAALLIASSVLLALGSARPEFHAYYEFQELNDLRIVVLYRTGGDRDECERTRNLMVQATLRACPNCKILDNKCLGKLDATQRKLLSDKPLADPAAQIPNGVVSYVSSDPQFALEACRLSEQRAIKTGQRSQVLCHPANTQRPLPKARNTGLDWPQNLLRHFAQAIAVLGASFSIFLAIQFLSARNPTDARDEYAISECPFKISNAAKRFMDILLAVTALLILAPVLLVVSVLILFIDGSPVFYVSRRFIALNQSVPILKFRTMVRDAASPKYRLKERFMNQGYLDIPVDCEVYTPIGRFLERTQLVEVLQLFNVIVHGMSLVGNRPLPHENVELLKSFRGWERRFGSPAGITGASQVVGKFNQTPEERLELECLYSHVYQSANDNILLCDFRILLYTVRILIFGKYCSAQELKRLLVRRSKSDVKSVGRGQIRS